MGFWSSLCSGISSAVSSVGSFLSGTASTIISTVGQLATKMSPYINAAIAVVKVIGAICDLLKPNETIEDKGERVLQAAEQGITLESCDNDFEEYKKRIDEFEIDPQIKHPVEQCQVVGMAYVVNGVMESSPYLRNFTDLLVLSIHDTTKSFFTPTRVKEYVELAQDMKVEIGKIKSYFDGSLASDDFDKVNTLLHTAEKKLDTTYSEKEFDGRLFDLSEEIRKM